MTRFNLYAELLLLVVVLIALLADGTYFWNGTGKL